MMETEQIVSLLVAERDRISRAIEALQGPAPRGRPRATPSTNTAPAPSASAPIPKKRRVSAAGRKAIAEAARRRWATIKASKAPEAANSAATKKSAPQSKPAPKKRRITAAGRKAMADAAKRRWAAIRASKAEGTKAEGSAPPSEDEQFKKRMLETMKASRGKQKKSAVKKKAA